MESLSTELSGFHCNCQDIGAGKKLEHAASMSEFDLPRGKLI